MDINEKKEKYYHGAYIQIWVEEFKKLLPILGKEGLWNLIAVALHIDKDGECWPSEKGLGRTTTNHPSTVSRNIIKLSKLDNQGDPILKIKKHRKKGNKFDNNIYKLLPASCISFGYVKGKSIEHQCSAGENSLDKKKSEETIRHQCNVDECHTNNNQYKQDNKQQPIDVVVKELIKLGMATFKVEELLKKFPLNRIKEVISATKFGPPIKNIPGFIVGALEKNWDLNSRKDYCEEIFQEREKESERTKKMLDDLKKAF